MAHFAQSPSFILHQVTCQFATGDTLFGPLNFSLEPSLCALVGRNGSGKTRLLRLLAGLDEPATGHIERFGSHAWVAQRRFARACALLSPRSTDFYSLDHVASACGYASASHLNRRFREELGITPTRFRQAG